MCTDPWNITPSTRKRGVGWGGGNFHLYRTELSPFLSAKMYERNKIFIMSLKIYVAKWRKTGLRWHSVVVSKNKHQFQKLKKKQRWKERLRQALWGKKAGLCSHTHTRGLWDQSGCTRPVLALPLQIPILLCSVCSTCHSAHLTHTGHVTLKQHKLLLPRSGVTPPGVKDLLPGTRYFTSLCPGFLPHQSNGDNTTSQGCWVLF